MTTCFSRVTKSYASDFRFKRKFHSYLLLAGILLLLTTSVNAHMKHMESDVVTPLDEEFPLSEEYNDVDNIEFHQAKIVDGILKEDHPVIMYKEDFVSEDFVPKTDAPHRLRKHKDPAHRRRRIGGAHSETEKYHPLQPEKIYFDILSSAPIVSSSETKAAAAPKLNVEVISLADPETKSTTEGPDGVQLGSNKYPKKYYHRRHRRNADRNSNDEHIIQKRNPYYSFTKVSRNANSIGGPPSISNYYLPSCGHMKHYQKHPIPGDYYNGPVSVPRPIITIDNRFGGPSNTDRVIWRDYTPTRNPNERLNITVRPPLSLFPQRTTQAPKSPVTQGPANRPIESPSFADAGSIYNTVATQAPVLQYPTAAPPKTSSSTACVWAIASCCTANDQTVRYKCFERYGCNLVFWNLNPCADNIRNNIITYLNQQFE